MTIKCGSPGNSKKHHLFLGEEIRSLCMKWMYSGEKYDIDLSTFGKDRDDCKGCAKKLPTTPENNNGI